MNDRFQEQVRQRLFRTKHAALEPVFERLHREILALGEDVTAYFPTVYVAYRVKTVFAAVFVRQDGYLDVHASVPETVNDPRLHTIQSPTFRHITRSLHLGTLDDLDGTTIGWLRLAYESARSS